MIKKVSVSRLALKDCSGLKNLAVSSEGEVPKCREIFGLISVLRKFLEK